VTWALALWRFMRGGRLAVALKQHYRLLALSISLAILFAALLPQDLKIISDEVHLLNVSLGMYQDQAPLQATGGEFADEELNYLSTSFNRRPHLFPFLTHLAHHATGYRVENVFAVNLLAGCALFLGTGLIAGQLIGGTATYCAPLLLSAVPALGSNITSGSFDTANLACLAWTILLLLRWRERPDAGLWPLLILTYGLLCHLRYEAPIYALAALPVLWAVRRSPTHRADLISWYSALAPLLLLPRLWRQPLFNLGWELTEGQWAFSLAGLADNSLANLTALASTDPHMPNSLPVAVYALAGIALFFYRQQRANPSFLVVFTVFAVCWLIVSSATEGRFFIPANFRYTLPLYFTMSLGAAYFWHQVGHSATRKVGRIATVLPLALALLTLGQSLPTTRSEYKLRIMTAPRERRLVLDYLADSGDNPLLVATRPGNTLLSGYDTWNPIYAEQHLPLLRQRIASGRTVYFIWGRDCEKKPRLCRPTIEAFDHHAKAHLDDDRAKVVLIELEKRKN
jgi:hypothetical protein